MSSPANPEKREGVVTPSDADIPDSIARALLNALQEKQTGNDLPPAVISIARVRAYQLQQCLVTGREPPEDTIQAPLDLISMGQEPSGLTNVADKVSTVSHTLEFTSNQPSSPISAKINSSRRGRTPTADAEIASVQANSLYTAIASGNDCPQVTRNSILEYTSSQQQLTSFYMSAKDIPEQLVLRGTSNEDVPSYFTQFGNRV